MVRETIIPRFWSRCSPKWNFGDAISYFLYDNLLIDFAPYNRRPWIIGSMLFDGAPAVEADDDNAALPSFFDDRQCEAIFWGCGLRSSGSLSPELAERCAVLAVRGPLSSSDLRLGADTPMGDPALLLPALYAPRTRKSFTGASVCIPHYLDDRSDLEILAASGCEIVLRPAIEPNLESLERFIDAVCSAGFVLCGALHGAIVAAAYDIPFGYWDGGNIDTPFKWADFSALIGIPCVYHNRVAEARDHYERAVRNSIRIPSMWPLLCASPAFIRPAGLIKVLRHELGRCNPDIENRFDDLLQQMESKEWRLEHLADLSRRITDQLVPTLVVDRDTARRQVAESGESVTRLSAELAKIRVFEAELVERAVNAERTAQELDAKLNEVIEQHSANAERDAALVTEANVRAANVERDLGKQIAALHNDKELTERNLAATISQNDAYREAAEAREKDARIVLETEQSAHGEALARNRVAAQADLAAAQAQIDAVIGRMGRVVRRLRSNKWARALLKVPTIGKFDARIRRQADQILAFLARFSEAELGMASVGREDRVLAYLLGLTPSVADLPLFDRDAYHTLNPDIVGSGIDPFIHYLEFGWREGRSPHPLLNYDYYTQLHPETARFDHSILEHYLRFGAVKGYDPCELFSTSDYLARYPDVRSSKCNPLLHYLRHPARQPHLDFDSDFYRMRYPDIVRAGFNPLAHFLLWGRGEGRQPTSGRAIGTIDQVARIGPAERTISRKPLVVMMEAFYPRPDQDSGSLDQMNFVKIFTALGYEVAFTALMDFAPDTATKRPLADLDVTCITASDYINVEEFVFLNAERISMFFLSRFNFGGNWIEKARIFCPHAQIIFNTVDLHHVRENRRARIENDKAVLANADVIRTAELGRIEVADVTIVVSEAERDLLATLTPAADVRVIPLIREIRDRSFPPFANRGGIAFVGGFQHQPNIDAVTTFLDVIWPKILAAAPTMKFHVIGSHLPESLSQRQDRNVEWVGYVPELEPWLDKVRLTVAPLRYGAGAKGKVITSLLNGVPVVASQIAAEGMGFADGDGVVTADGPEDFVRRVLALHDDEAVWSQTSMRGFDAVRTASSLERGIDLMGQILPRLAAA